MDKREVFDIFRFRRATKKDDFPITNDVDTQEQNDQFVDNPDLYSIQTETIRVQDRPLINPFHLYLAQQFANTLDTDLGDLDSGPIRPMLRVSKYINTLLLMNTYYSLIIKLNLDLFNN